MHGPPTSDAKRARKRERDRRRYRRQLAERAVADVEYSAEVVDYLVRYGWLRDGDTVGDAISRAMQDAAEADLK
jgi:hypothetical protein